MPTLDITPHLGQPDISAMFDVANDKLVSIDFIDLVLVPAPDPYEDFYKGPASRVFHIDIGAGLNYYQVPAEDFSRLTWHQGIHLYRLSTAPTDISKFTLLLGTT